MFLIAGSFSQFQIFINKDLIEGPNFTRFTNSFKYVFAHDHHYSNKPSLGG